MIWWGWSYLTRWYLLFCPPCRSCTGRQDKISPNGFGVRLTPTKWAPTKKSITSPPIATTQHGCQTFPMRWSVRPCNPKRPPRRGSVPTDEIPPFRSSESRQLEGTSKQADIDYKQEERGLMSTRTGRRSRISAKDYTGGGLIASYCVFNRMRMSGGGNRATGSGEGGGEGRVTPTTTRPCQNRTQPSRQTPRESACKCCRTVLDPGVTI